MLAARSEMERSTATACCKHNPLSGNINSQNPCRTRFKPVDVIFVKSSLQVSPGLLVLGYLSTCVKSCMVLVGMVLHKKRPSFAENKSTSHQAPVQSWTQDTPIGNG